MSKKIDEINTAEKILKILYKALGNEQFNFHVAKLKGKSTEKAGEEVMETKLQSIDTKRLLELVSALEKIANLKKKKCAETAENENKPGKIVLPEVEFPEDFGGDDI